MRSTELVRSGNRFCRETARAESFFRAWNVPVRNLENGTPEAAALVEEVQASGRLQGDPKERPLVVHRRDGQIIWAGAAPTDTQLLVNMAPVLSSDPVVA